MKPVGSGLNSPTEDQIKDNTDLVPEPKSTQGVSGNIGASKNKSSSMEVKLQVGIDNDSKSTISVDTGLDVGMFSVNIETEYGATKSIDRIDALMNKIVTKQTELGAVSNRLQSTMEYQQVQKDTKMAVLSVIKDADIAKESSEYIKAQILQQTTASLLSQANQTPSIALRLLAI